MYLPLLYCIKAVVCRLYEMLYPCICNVVISCWKSGAYGSVICRGGTDMCFVPRSRWEHLDLEQYRISGLTRRKGPLDSKRKPKDDDDDNDEGAAGGGGGELDLCKIRAPLPRERFRRSDASQAVLK